MLVQRKWLSMLKFMMAIQVAVDTMLSLTKNEALAIHEQRSGAGFRKQIIGTMMSARKTERKGGVNHKTGQHT